MCSKQQDSCTVSCSSCDCEHALLCHPNKGNRANAMPRFKRVIFTFMNIYLARNKQLSILKSALYSLYLYEPWPMYTIIYTTYNEKIFLNAKNIKRQVQHLHLRISLLDFLGTNGMLSVRHCIEAVRLSCCLILEIAVRRSWEEASGIFRVYMKMLKKAFGSQHVVILMHGKCRFAVGI